MKCKKCGAQLEQDCVFCPECGAKCEEEENQGTESSSQQAMIFCPNCGQQMEADSAFCPNCGQPVEADEEKPSGKRNLKKIIIPVAAAAAVLAVAVGVGSVVLSSSGSKKEDKIYNKEKLIYVKDNEMYYTSLKKPKKEPVEYTDDVREDGGTVWGILNRDDKVVFTEDGKYCFYPERLAYDDSFRLMRKKVGSKKEAEKIDSDVLLYHLLDSGDIVYKKNSNALYVWNGKEKTKLDSDVSRVLVSSKEKSVLWTTDNGDGTYDLYFQKLGKKGEKTKLESNITALKKTNENFSHIFIIKNDAFYLIDKQNEKTKLAGGIQEVFGIDEDNITFYFTQEARDRMTAADFVTDDIPQSQNSYHWDNQRRELENWTLSFGMTDIYYYNGKSKELIAEKADSIEYSFPGGMIFLKKDMDDLPKIRLSEISYTGEVEERLYDYIGKSGWYLAAGKNIYELDDYDFMNRIYRNEAKKMLYALTGRNGDENYDLVSINYGKSGETKAVDEDVVRMEGIFNGKVYYYKDEDRQGYSADLYCDKKMVLSDVAMGSLTEVPESDKVVCITDGNSDRQQGTLTILKGDKDTNIADDVSYFDVIGEKSILMLTDYNFNKNRGDLKYFQGKECITIDSDVSAFYSIGNGKKCP